MKGKLVGYHKRFKSEVRPTEPYYAFIFDHILLPIQMFREHYDTEGELEKVVLGDDRARRN